MTAPTLTYTDTQCYNGVTYYYHVQACTANDSCASVMSNCITLTPCTTPGAPTIAADHGRDACAASGITVTYTVGSPVGGSYNLLEDGNVVVTGYTSGATYVPGDTSSHTYVVRAVCRSNTADSTGVAGTDINNTPGAPIITAVTDISTCTSGITVTYTAGSHAGTSYNLLRDGAVVVTGYTSGATYNPGDTSSHIYIIQAVNGACITNSAGVAGTDLQNAPGAPTITAFTDLNACTSGIALSCNAGSPPGASYNLLKDGTVVVTGYTSGATYNPGDTSSHTYIVQAVNGTCTTNSAGVVGNDVNNSPGAPIITAVTDVNACAQSGIKVTYTVGSGATGHNLLKDGTLVVTGYTSGATYSPGDTSSHTYIVQALNTCGPTNSTGVAGTDADNLPAIPAAPSVADANACTQSGVIVTWTAVSGSTGYDLRRDSNALTVVKGVTSPYLYNPGDTNSHTYQVRATNDTCNSTWSTGTAGTDADNGPGAPTITAVADVNACAATGISVTYSAGTPAGSSYNILKDGTVVVTGYTSGATYVPGDTSSHTYIVQAVSGTCTTNSTGMAGTDATGSLPGEAASGSSSSTAQTWSSKTSSSWPPVSGASGYTLYRGERGQLPNLLTNATDSCTKYTGSSTSATEPSDPTSHGGLYWYLITASNACGEGIAGNATAGPRIVNSSGTCTY